MATKPKPQAPYLDEKPTLNWDAFEQHMAQVRGTAQQPVEQPAGFVRRAADYALSGIQGVIGVPQAAVGLADIATGGRVGKFLDPVFRPDEAVAYLQSLKSDDQQKADRAVQDASKGQPGDDQDLLSRVGRVASAAVDNPSVIAHSIVQSIPSIAAGGVLGRGVMAAAGRVSPGVAAASAAPLVASPASQIALQRAGALAGGVGEGAVMAGQQAEAIRTDPANPDRTLSLGQSALALGTGVAGAAIGMGSGRLAQRLGIENVDNMLAGVHGNTVAKQSLVRRVINGAVTEGLLEELPQSVVEQVAQNAALGKPLDEGVEQAIVLGTLSGSAMGVGAQAFHSSPAPAAVPDAGPLSRAANLALAGAAAGTPPEAPQAPQPPEARRAPVAPVALTPEQTQALLSHANERMAALEQKAKGTPDEKAEDGTVTPGTPKQFLTPAEKAEVEFLKAAGGDVQALAHAYGPGTPTFDAGGSAGDGAGAAPLKPVDDEAAMARMEREQRRLDGEAAGRARAANDNDLGVVSGAPVAPTAPVAPQAPTAPDAPVRPEPPVLEDIPEHHQDDILNPQGKPFKERFAARRKQANLPEPEAYDVVQVQGGFALRRKAAQPQRGDAPKTGDFSESGSASTTQAPATPETDAASSDILDSDILNPAGQPFKEKAAAVAAQKRAGATETGVLTQVPGGWVVRAQPTTLGPAGIEVQPAGTRGTAGQDVVTVDDNAHGAATSPENDLSEPTEGQKKAGNYKKGHVNLNGLDISVENPAGSTRSGTDRDGKAWTNTLQHHYGYIKGTLGNDEDHFDVFVKPGTPLDHGGDVYVVDQQHPDTGEFDEHKALIGFDSEEEARAAYASNYADGWTGLKAVKTMPFADFKAWVKDGSKTAPLNPEAFTPTGTNEQEPGTPAEDGKGTKTTSPEAPTSGGSNGAGTPAGTPGVPGAASGPEAGGVGTPTGNSPEEQPGTTGTTGTPGTGGPGTPTGEATPKTPKAPRKTKAERDAEAAEARRADYFAPGNIVKSYGGHDRVVAYTTPDESGRWSVKVQAVVKDGDKWVNEANSQERQHSTQPGDKEIEAGPIERAPKPEKKVKADKPAPDLMAELLEGSDATGIADVLYEGIRDVELDDLPTILPDDKLIRLPVKVDERDKIEAALKKAKFRITDRQKGASDAERMMISAIYKPERTSIGDAGEKMGGGRKDQFPPAPKDADEAAMDKFLVSLHPSNILDPEANADQTFGNLMFKEAIYSTARMPLAYIVGRLRDQYREIRYGGDSDKRVLLKALQSATYAPKVAEYAEAYRTRLSDLNTTLGEHASIKGALDAFMVKYFEQSDSDYKNWTDPAGIQLSTVTDLSARKVLNWFGSFGADENATDQTHRVKKKDADKPPYLERVVRVGMKDHRQGRNVDENDFTEKFGFKGTEFGNWVTQDERQVNLNLAYDSLMDMADLLGMPPKSIGVVSHVGMAIGARGKGGRAAAHFEPGNNVINLMKTKGSGTVGHEWFHAFDHNLSVVAPSATTQQARALVNSLAEAMKTRTDWRKTDALLRNALSGSQASDNRNTPPKQAVLQAILPPARGYRATPPMLRDSWRPTDFQRAADKMDSGADKKYWSTPVEMLARGFESYLFDESRGGSPYLVGPSRGDGAMTEKNGYNGRPYPTGEEREYVSDQYRVFFQQIDPATLQVKPYAVEPTITEFAGIGFVVADQHGLGVASSDGYLKLYETREAADAAAAAAKGATKYLPLDKHAIGKMNATAIDFMVRIDAIMEEMGIIQWPEVKNDSMAESMFFHLRQGWWPKDNPALLEYAAKAHRKDPKELRGDRVTLKRAQEDFEAAVARFAGQRIDDMRATGADDRAIYDYFVALYAKQPNLDVRNTTSIENQAYSTPLPIGFIAGLLTRTNSSTVLFDPTEGNGMLTITGNPAKLVGIEIEQRRANNLRLMKRGTVYEGDALKLIDEKIKPQQADALHINPPFGPVSPPIPVASWDGKDFDLSKLDHVITAKAMKAMADKGRATIIIGANKEAGKLLRADQIFLNWLYTNYNVADHFEIDGQLYKRMGAEWPLRVLIVAGRKQSHDYYDMTAPIERVMDFNQLWSRYEQAAQRSEQLVVGAGRKPDSPSGANPAGPGLPGGDKGQAGGPDNPGTKPGSSDQAGGNGSGIRGGKPQGQPTGNGGTTGGNSSGNNGAGGNGQLGTPGPSGAGGPGNGGSGGAGSGGPGPGGLANLTPEEIERLLKQGAANSGKPDGKPTPPRGGGGGGGGKGGKRSSKPSKPGPYEGAAKNIRNILDDYDDGGRTVFSRKMSEDEAYSRLWPSFSEIWDGIAGAIRDVGQAVRAFAAQVSAMFSDIAHRLMPFMSRFINEKVEEAKARPSAKKPIIPDPVDSESQVIYRGRSHGFSGGIYVPRSMAEALETAFSRFEAKHGDIDEFVQREIGFDSIEEMHKGLGGYQVDALGLSIAAMKDGNGFIIGDDTGVGKGRTAAGLIAWGLKQGKVPVFFSMKKELYSDMWGDLRDIGKGTNDIQLTNTDTVIVDKKNDNTKIMQATSKDSTAAMQHIINTGEMPAGKKIIFSSYSQMNPMRANKLRRDAVMRLARDGKAMFIMDESHNAAGDSATGEFFNALLTGEGLFGKAGTAKGAANTPAPDGWAAPMSTYLSATFAKRADNLPVYGRTLLRFAGDGKMDSLKDLFSSGGDVLMRVASEMLVKSGAMIRRERSYEGVKFNFKVDEANAPRDARLIDEVTSVLRQVVHADRAFEAWRKTSNGQQAVLDYLQLKGYTVSDAASTTQAGIDKAMFTSYVHNYIEQLLLATKVDSIVDEVVASLNRGEKPCIGIKSTMEAAVNDYKEQENIRVGDEMPSFGWQSVLSRAERSARRVTLTPPNSSNKKDKIKVFIPEDIMPPNVFAEFQRAKQMIASFQSTLPASPIDAIQHKLGQYFIVTNPDGSITATKTPASGSKSRPLVFGDISGKSVAVDYSGKVPVMRSNGSRNNNATVTGYQDGRIDVVLITAAGATGLSLHASENALDQRPRFMVIGQPDADISIFKQKLGRIHRTGQVEWPGFVVLATGIPAERRPLAVLRKKLKKMFSATSGGSSATDIEAVDFINIYGDKVVWDYLGENLDIADFMAIDMSKDMPVDISMVASGRAALLPVSQQEEFFEDVERGFTQEIQERNATGTNELERRELNLDAEEIPGGAVLEEGVDDSNPFTATATLGRYKVNIIGDIPTPESVRAAIQQSLNGRDMGKIIAEIESSLKVAYDEALSQSAARLRDLTKERDDAGTKEGRRNQLIDQIANLQRKQDDFPVVKRNTIEGLKKFGIGKQFGTVQFGDVEAEGVVVSINVSSSATKRGNPYSPSNFTITIIRNVPNGRVSLPLSAINHTDSTREKYVGDEAWRDQIDDWFALRSATGGREERFIATGNLLRAKMLLPAIPKGEIIKFTMRGKKDTVDGILMAQSFVPNPNASTEESIRYHDAATDYMLSLLASKAQADADRDSYYQGRLGAIVGLINHREAIPDADLQNLQRHGVMGANGRWKMSVGYGNTLTFTASPSGSAIAKALKPIIGDMSKKGGDFTMDSPSKLTPAVLRSVMKILATFGPITVDIDAAPYVRPIVRKYYDAETGRGDAGESPVASRGASASEPRNSGQSVEQVQGLVNAITARWKNAPRVVVVQSLKDPALPESIRKEAADLMKSSSGKAGAPEGFFSPDDGVVYLIVGQLGGDADTLRVLMHESLGHFGLRGVFGSEFGTILDRIATLNPAKVRDAATKLGYDYDKPSERRLATEEVLAYMAQTSPELGWVQRAVAAVRSWLRDHVPGFAKMGLSDAEIIRDYILPARQFVKDGGPNGRGPNGGGGGSASTRPMFSRPLAASLEAGINNVRDVKLAAGYTMGDFFNTVGNTPGRLSWWHKSVGTMDNLAKRSPPFKRVYEAVQSFLNDVSYYAAEAADMAPRILPKMESWRDIKKTPLSHEDTKAISAAIFQGTLTWGRDASGRVRPMADIEADLGATALDDKAHMMVRDGHVAPNVLRMWQGLPMDRYESIIEGKFDKLYLKAGAVFTPAELRTHIGLTGDRQDDGSWSGQIGLYQEFRKAVDKSLTNLTISQMLRYGGKQTASMRDQVLAAPDLDTAAMLLRDKFFALAAASPTKADALNENGNKIVEFLDHAKDLMARGYAPLSRFGQYTLDVVDADGKRLYFGLFEDTAERSKKARELTAANPGAAITQGTVSQEAYKLFAGISPETAELFGEMLGLDADGDDMSSAAFQEYLKNAVSNRSALKRMIERKGIAGFSEDAGRVLAGFVYSNARQTASNLHRKEIDQAVSDVPKGQGQLQDAAEKLSEYVKNPTEEVPALRGFLFAQYLGGSIASAIVNATQPFAVSLPYLSQFGGATKAARQLAAALKQAVDGKTGDAALDAALKRAEEDGTVSPQEVHSLMAQSMGKAQLRSGDGTRAGNILAGAHNAGSKLALVWGNVFGVAEQFNRRLTFIAAYRMAVENGNGQPAKFAKQAVEDTQFTYNKGNKPQWARGAFGSVLFTFKQYSINYVQLLTRMATAGEPGSPERKAGQRAALLAIAVLFMMAGGEGLPFVQDIEDVIDGAMQRMGYNFSTKQKMKEFLARELGKGAAEFIMSGVTGIPGVPIDLSGRLGLGNLIPGTGLVLIDTDHTRSMLELAGPAGDLGKRVFEAGNMLAKGDVFGAAKSVSPIAAQNAMQGIDMWNTGMYRDKRGYKVIDTTPGEAIAKGLGFQPQPVKDTQDATREVQRTKGQYNLEKADVQDRWARAKFDGDRDAEQRLREEVAQWNIDNPHTPIQPDMASILKKVRQMRMTKEQRVLANAPKAIREEAKRQLEEAK